MKIRYTKPDGNLGDFELTDQPVTIGRSPEADITVADEKVSRVQCGIRMWDGEYFLKDLKSKNGTFVNSQRVDVHKLVAGDVIRVGSSTLTFGPETIMGANTAIREIGGQMDEGKGYSTILKEIVRGDKSKGNAPASPQGAAPSDESSSEEAPAAAGDKAAGAGDKTRKKVRIVIKKRPPGAAAG